MMNEVTLIAAGVAGVFALTLFVALVVIARQSRRVESVETALERVDTGLRRLSSELHLLTQAQHALVGKLEEVAVASREVVPQQVPTRGYEQAIRMARTGAPVGQLVEACGITRSEAELLISLHGPQAAA